jgi:DNA recombination protein RmuC
MTPQLLDILLLLVTFAAVGFGVWSRLGVARKMAQLAAEADQSHALRTERDDLRVRAETAARGEAVANANREAAERQSLDAQRQNEALQGELATLRAEHGKIVAEVAAVRESRTLMKDTFALQSTEAMRKALADLREAEAAAREQREKADREQLSLRLKPVSDTLERFEKHVNELEQKRASDVGGLKAQIDGLMKASLATQEEAKKLSHALSRGAGVQGRWGEQTLRNVLKTAGLDSQFDFKEQFHIAGEAKEANFRPDVVVRMPGGGVFVIDAKCSLTAYLEATNAPDETARDAALNRHATSLRSHITGLSGKSYWDQFKNEKSPDFVAMFVPGDSFLVAALDRAPDLMTEAMDKRVLLVTPTTLFGLCKAVAYGWRVEEQSRNADEVARLGKELYKRLSVMGGHAKSMGASLEGAVEKYNALVGSLESQVLTQARKFEDLKVDHEGKQLDELPLLEVGVRKLAKLTVVDKED